MKRPKIYLPIATMILTRHGLNASYRLNHMLKSGYSDDELCGKSKEKTVMRTIRIVTCALVIASTLHMPASAQAPNFRGAALT